jgi:hypothetical protein
MTVTRDVIVDLLPLYLAGEASEGSRALIDAYLRDDAVLAEYVRAHAVEPSAGFATPPAPDLELRSLRRTRTILAWQRWLFAFTVTFTAIGLSTRISFAERHLASTRLLILDYPLPFGASLVAAAACWAGYLALRRRYTAT